MAITYDAGTNTITVTGYTESSPCTFTDIYDADVAGSWGVVSKQCDNQFCFACKLIIGDGSTATWFADSSKQIIFQSGIISGDWQTFIEPKANATFRSGTLVDATKKITDSGCNFYFMETTYYSMPIKGDGDIFFYSSTFTAYTKEARLYDPARCWNSRFNNMCFLASGGTNVFNYQADNSISHSLTLRAGSAVYDTLRLTANSCVSILYFNNTNATVRNIYAIGTFQYFIQPANATGDSYLIDCIFPSDAWTFVWQNPPNGTFYRQYSFDLKIIDKDNTPINGATVKIWDKDSTLIVDTTTDANGVIATQTISRGYYTEATGDTLNEYSPHLIKVEKAGYTTYEADFTLEEKTDWTIALQTGGGGLMRNPPMTGGMV